MKKVYLIVFACLLATIMMGSAFAGQEPYVAVVGEDTAIDPFYISPKLYQFTHPFTNYSPENFSARFSLIPKREVCDKVGNSHNVNYKTGKGNSGWYVWNVVLPKKLEGDLNIVVECGILKPNTDQLGPDIINWCAGETGEVIGTGFCTREPQSDLKPTALPKITAKALPGPNNAFTPFNLTAYRNPSNYIITKDPITGALVNNASLQVLDGSVATRIALKACMDKTIFVKMPKEDEINAATPAQVETELVAGDVIQVRLDIPSANTVDVFCNKHSVKIMGIGEPEVAEPFLGK